MSPAEIKLALQEPLGAGVSLSVSTYIILACGWVLSIVLGAFITSYFGKRGETAAVKKDLRTITDQLTQTTKATEEIKAAILDELWVRQRAWELKHTYYVTIIRGLSEVSRAMRQWGPAVMREIEEEDPEWKKVHKAEGTFIRVLRNGRPFGKIFHTAGVHRFYEGDHEKLGGADLQDANLEQLKAAIQSRYERR